MRHAWSQERWRFGDATCSRCGAKRRVERFGYTWRGEARVRVTFLRAGAEVWERHAPLCDAPEPRP